MSDSESPGAVAVCLSGVPFDDDDVIMPAEDVAGFIHNELDNVHITGLVSTIVATNIHERIESANDLAALGMELWLEQATAFTCIEAETLATFLRCHDNPEGAEAFLEAHSVGDYEEDQHYVPGNESRSTR
jgi:hypothetical protein